MTFENTIDLVDMFVPEDNEVLSSFWDIFKSGVSNSGTERKGKRS